MRKKSHRRRWEKDPSTIYRVMGMQQAFTPAEQATLNLPVRESLQSLRDGTADENHWNTLAGVANVCLLRGERIAQQVVDVAKDAQAAVLDILERHKRTGKWGMNHHDMDRLLPCIDLYEQLIELSTPAQMIAAMRDTIKRIDAGQIIEVA